MSHIMVDPLQQHQTLQWKLKAKRAGKEFQHVLRD